jgi:Transglycosylase SLT domain/Sel1 repeat
MKAWFNEVTLAACLMPITGFAAVDAPSVAAEPFVGLPAAGVLIADAKPSESVLKAGSGRRYGIYDLEAVAKQGDLQAQVELADKYAHAEGVPKDLQKANGLYCRAARYGHAEGQFKLGWVYANGRGVPRDDGVAAVLFKMAADRGHEHAAKLLTVVNEQSEVKMPACLLPDALPPASPLPAQIAVDEADGPMPIAPKDITLLVQRLAPQFEIDSRLALALISVESAFNPSALSPAKAQGLMQLIPETAERFGVKRPFNPDDNIKGGLAYLRWLFAYFQGDVSLVLAAYNAGEGAVDKYRGIPPYNETRDYVKKITGMYRKLTHPYNPSIVKPSPVISQLKRM